MKKKTNINYKITCEEAEAKGRMWKKNFNNEKKV